MPRKGYTGTSMQRHGRWVLRPASTTPKKSPKNKTLKQIRKIFEESGLGQIPSASWVQHERFAQEQRERALNQIKAEERRLTTDLKLPEEERGL